MANFNSARYPYSCFPFPTSLTVSIMFFFFFLICVRIKSNGEKRKGKGSMQFQRRLKNTFLDFNICLRVIWLLLLRRSNMLF